MTTKALPGHLQIPPSVKRLVKEHRGFKDEPLLLAMVYKPDRMRHDLFLLEIIENFGGGVVDADRELFEIAFGERSGIELEPGQRLHLVLSNPGELGQAVEEGWPGIKKLQRAVDRGDFQVLYSHPAYGKLQELIHA